MFSGRVGSVLFRIPDVCWYVIGDSLLVLIADFSPQILAFLPTDLVVVFDPKLIKFIFHAFFVYLTI